MKTFQKIQNKRKSIDDPVECIGIFMLIELALLFAANLVHHYSWQLLYAYLFFQGWFLWTFFEYMLHRFAWHSKRTNKPDFHSDTFTHLYHHTHPGEIKMNNLKRFLILMGNLILVLISIWIHDYFTLLAGFVFSFGTYTFMHWLLHQKIAQKILRKQVRYHIYHHCKYPDKCFVIMVTWWDDLFRTVPYQDRLISPKTIAFYFGEKIHKSITTIKTVMIFLMILLSCQKSPAQQRILHYDITRNGNVIGYVTVTEKTKGNIVFLELKSEVKTRLLTYSYNSEITEDAVFAGKVMTYSYYYKKENGRETSIEARKSDGYFNVVNNGDESLQHYIPVRNNTLQLFYDCPGIDIKSFSNHYQQFLDIKKVAGNKYRLTLPNGNCSYYNYNKNGICNRVDIERTLFTIHFELRKETRFP